MQKSSKRHHKKPTKSNSLVFPVAKGLRLNPVFEADVSLTDYTQGMNALSGILGNSNLFRDATGMEALSKLTGEQQRAVVENNAKVTESANRMAELAHDYEMNKQAVKDKMLDPQTARENIRKKTAESAKTDSERAKTDSERAKTDSERASDAYKQQSQAIMTTKI